MTIHLENDMVDTEEFNLGQVASQVAETALKQEQFPYDAQIALVITDNEEIKQVNREFRDMNMPTDVLSFPMIPYEKPADYSAVEEDYASYEDPDTQEIVLGDIMISWDKVVSQAEEYGHSRKREFAFLVAHSMLHLLGYDHMTEEEAHVMEEKQEKILENLGICRK